MAKTDRLVELEKVLRVYDSCETLAQFDSAVNYAYLMWRHWARVCPSMLGSHAMNMIIRKAHETAKRLDK